MSDDRPSIAELQRLIRTASTAPTADDERKLRAFPVLLEIAAAALALKEQEFRAEAAAHLVWTHSVPSEAERAAHAAESTQLAMCLRTYDAALAKVRQ